MTTTDKYNGYTDKSFPSHYNETYSTDKRHDIINLEQTWINKLHEQVEFANSHVLTKFQLKLKIARRWKPWNR